MNNKKSNKNILNIKKTLSFIVVFSIIGYLLTFLVTGDPPFLIINGTFCFTNSKELDLSTKAVTDKDVKLLRYMKKLKNLNLSSTEITNINFFSIINPFI